MKKFRVEISEIQQLCARLREINNNEIQDMEFIDDQDNVIEIDLKHLEKWKFMGLNNASFVDSGFYLEGFKNEE